ncbi:MAG: hypothetical protein IJN35_00075, partial [Muribaculaceae bacterium]|nr:hypothetical protein [Muribaculaceae bacterium]
MKKFTTLLLAILLVLPAMAAEKVQNQSRFYFALPSGWSNACFMVGHGSYSQGYDMLNVENTNLYFHEQNGDWSADDNNLQWAVFDVQGWGGEGYNLDHRKNYSAQETAIYSMNGDFEYQKYYLLADGSYENIASYTSLNHTQTVTIEGGEGTISMSSYELTAANTATATNGTTSVNAAYTANVECTATAADGYRFVGWYNGETLLSDKPTYTYVAENAEKTIVAKFEEVTAETPVLSNFTASATEVMVGETITFTCAVENGEVANIVYKINDEAIVGNTWTPEACGVYTATATYEGATPVELASTITVTEVVVFNVTVPVGTPACYIVGNFNGQNWDSFNPMQEVDDTHYTWSFKTTTMDFVYKYTCTASWDNVEVNADGSDVANRTYNENDVVAMFKGYENYSENITYNNSYLLDVAEIGWKDADAQFAAWFYNKNMPDNNAVLVQGFTAQVEGFANVILFYLDENHIKDNLKVAEAFNFT